MKLNEIKLNEGWSTVKTALATNGQYQVDITKNFISAGKIELYAVIYTLSHKKKYEELIFSGSENNVNFDEIENKAKEILKNYTPSVS